MKLRGLRQEVIVCLRLFCFSIKNIKRYLAIKGTVCYYIIRKRIKEGDDLNIQFKKGVLELCVLSVLEQKDCYGYQLVNELSSNISISEGTIYPLLRRLKKDGYVTTYLKESQEGPPRKYYELTEEGKKMKHVLSEEWFSFIDAVNNLLTGRKEDE